MSALVPAIAVCVGFALGWASAHGDVAIECERLGSFYVGKQTFECKETK